ncbi:MAG: hypothetical protein DDT26_01751 [Dehalococcoidia bacterium]|nr:hypothetical protein [Chloroflexota bacterium]
MTEEMILWEYRQMAALVRLRDGKPADEPEQVDDLSYDDYLRELRGE